MAVAGDAKKLAENAVNVFKAMRRQKLFSIDIFVISKGGTHVLIVRVSTGQATNR